MAKLWSAWYGLVMAGGLGFGLIGERRPFGNDTLAHPLVVYFAAVAVGLLILRVVLARPVPEVIPERVLVVGCLSGVAAFLVGNFISAHVVPGVMPQ
jgi:hypothetical protein